MYIYELYTYIFREFDRGRIYSPVKLEEEKLMGLMCDAIKEIGQINGQSISRVACKVNELLGSEPVKTNIDELVDMEYYFADKYNCKDWLENVINPDFKSEIFNAPVSKRDKEYPCRIGLDIIDR